MSALVEKLRGQEMANADQAMDAAATLIEELCAALRSATDMLTIAADFMGEGGTTDAVRLEVIRAGSVLAKADNAGHLKRGLE